MKIAVISVTEKGGLLSKKITCELQKEHYVKRYCFEKKSDENAERFCDIKKLTENIFEINNALIFICACGIAVRSISAHIKSKETDPAVIVVDDRGKFVIPILSGHIGGANRLSEIIAEIINAVPVVTTATDTGGKFSPDSFACANNLIITDIKMAKEIATTILDNEKIGLCSEYPCKNIPKEIIENVDCSSGIFISCDLSKKPFVKTLNLVPKNVVVGIGCKRNTTCEDIEKHFLKCLEKENIDINRVCKIATIDIKKDEKGLLEFCKEYKLSLCIYTARELMELAGDFSKSDFVLKQTGADNICERSAVKCSGGRLIMHKTASNGVTVAIAEMPVEIDFERKVL